MKNRPAVCIQINPSNAKSNHLKSFKNKTASYCFYQYARKCVFYSLSKCDITVFSFKVSYLRWNQSPSLMTLSWVMFAFVLSEKLYSPKSQYESFVCRSAHTWLGMFRNIAADFKAWPLTFCETYSLQQWWWNSFHWRASNTCSVFAGEWSHGASVFFFFFKYWMNYNQISWNDSRLWHFY